MELGGGGSRVKDVINGEGGGRGGKTRGGMEGNVTLIALDPGDLIMCSAPSPPSITHTYTHTKACACRERVHNLQTSNSPNKNEFQMSFQAWS